MERKRKFTIGVPKIVLLGDAKVGKTSIMIKFVDNTFSETQTMSLRIITNPFLLTVSIRIGYQNEKSPTWQRRTQYANSGYSRPRKISITNKKLSKKRQRSGPGL
jgi:GTPase SAR1 family protein